MEYNSDSNSSDKDKRMIDSYESYSDSEESEEKKNKKKKKKSEHASTEKNDTSERKKPGLFDALERQDKSEKKDVDDENDTSNSKESAEIPENPEEISEEERRQITFQIVEARDADLKLEIASTEQYSPEETEILGNAMFIEVLSKRLIDGKTIDDEMLDTTVQEVADQLELNSDDYEQTNEDDPEDDTKNTTVSSSSPAKSRYSPPRSSTGSYSSNVPPSGGGPIIRSSSVSSAGGINNIFSDNQSINPNSINMSQIEFANRRRRGAELLVGGIVGYLIGRRRGRIKTEQRLLPIQDKLEAQVNDLNEKITIREEKIRALTSEKISREGEVARKAIADKLEAKAKSKLETKQINREVIYENETSNLAARRPERIASFILAKPELSTIPSKEVAAMTTNEMVNSMSEQEANAIASKIKIEGQSAKELFERGRLSKSDLLEVVAEYIRGEGKAEKMLSEKLRPNNTSEAFEILNHSSTPSTSSGADDSSDKSTDIPNHNFQSLYKTSSYNQANAGNDWTENSTKYLNTNKNNQIQVMIIVTTILITLAAMFLLF